MKRWIRSLPFVIFSLALVLLVMRLYAAPLPCTVLWNNCQEDCEGQPHLVVYGSGGQAVECFSPPGSGCNPYWCIPCQEG